MPVTIMEEVVQAAQKMVRDAQNEDKLEQLTNRIVRKEVEQSLSLKPRSLDAAEYKAAVKEAIRQIVEEEENPIVVVRSNMAATVKETKSTAKALTHSPRSALKATTSKVKTKTKVSNKVVIKSKESIEDSDDEPQPNGDVRPPSQFASNPIDQSDGTRDGGPEKKRRKTGKTASARLSKKDVAKAKPAQGAKKAESPATTGKGATEDADGSESDMSVLVDEVPARKRKGKEKDTVKKSKGGGKTKAVKDNNEPSLDDETIKKLKAMVYACGVRKAWSRELKDLDKPSQQISYLRSLLSGLGMKGRFTLEQAKSIKAKRDLAQEIQDVKEFAEKHTEGGRASRSKAGTANQAVDEDNDEDEDETGPPRRRQSGAQRSIMAFLEDQSDEE